MVIRLLYFKANTEIHTSTEIMTSDYIARGVHPSEAMMHFPPVSDSPPYFRKILRLENFQNFTFSRQNFRFSSSKISDDLFLVIDHKFRMNFLPILPVLLHFPSDCRKLLSPYQKFPPVLKKFISFLHALCVIPPVFTMMHLCTTQLLDAPVHSIKKISGGITH